MTGNRPEFSRRIPLAQFGSEPFRQQIAATEAERAALAKRFDLIAIDRLSAAIEVVRHGQHLIELHAEFEAEFVQSCVVTLDPVGGTVSQRFTLRYGPPETEAEAGGGMEDDIAFEPIVGDSIDIGEAVAQEFSLLLPPFPHSPDAVIEAKPPPPDEAGPFAELSRLLGRRGR